MGLDISINFDNQENLYLLDEFEKIQEEVNLSRTFCNFMCRREVVEDCRPELDQIGELTGADITFLYNMQEYTEEWEIDEMLEFEDDEDEKKRLKQSMLKKNTEVENNIEEVKLKLSLLIEKLGQIENLEQKLDKTNYDTLGIKKYFSNFNNNPGDGYIDNNLGQDLRNLYSLLNFGLKNGSKTIFFNYG
ncbi:hypothetical protein [Flavobacterium limi]|uniref:Uncharacterized protein n=1 Tax=Flavobacterium limi TaxID=2045105 RepID=A0ABQ1UFL2_9FLAO|nr:hypothetical protein [Flavobacterium limi]GGF16592.1 hypothetical protein GCM10011518_27530 [Flavobacterium limi]